MKDSAPVAASHSHAQVDNQPAAGPAGTSAAPPGYGIDFLDRQPAAGRTGLPPTLKAGIEALSGLSMDDVQVHYNASRPAQLGALAYAQGADIYLGPGQERHLPHEAWHVVQQKQGRVKPTLQAKGLPVNDERGLEREADRQGAQALRRGQELGLAAAARAPTAAAPLAGQTIQLCDGLPDDKDQKSQPIPTPTSATPVASGGASAAVDNRLLALPADTNLVHRAIANVEAKQIKDPLATGMSGYFHRYDPRLWRTLSMDAVLDAALNIGNWIDYGMSVPRERQQADAKMVIDQKVADVQAQIAQLPTSFREALWKVITGELSYAKAMEQLRKANHLRQQLSATAQTTTTQDAARFARATSNVVHSHTLSAAAGLGTGLAVSGGLRWLTRRPALQARVPSFVLRGMRIAPVAAGAMYFMNRLGGLNEDMRGLDEKGLMAQARDRSLEPVRAERWRFLELFSERYLKHLNEQPPH